LGGSSAFRRRLDELQDVCTGSQVKILREARKQFEESAVFAGQWAAQEQMKTASLEKYTASRADLDHSLDEYVRTNGSQKTGKSSRGRQRLSYLLGTLGVISMSAGAFFLLWFHRQTEQQMVHPLQNILVCVEAASTGDVSRMPDRWAGDEMGRLAQAVGRLISVLARSENLVYHLAALVEASGDAIISQSLDGKILSWNKGAQRLYGFAAQEVQGKSIAMLMPQDGGHEMRDILKRISTGEKVPPFEAVHLAKNGRGVHAFVKVAAIYDSMRRIIGASFCAQELAAPAPTLGTPSQQAIPQSFPQI
jgi:PAS domain S-box-containing protein